MNNEKYDLRQLADLVEVSEKDMEFLEELVDGYETKGAEVLAHLESSLNNKDHGGIESHAHRFAGMASNLGLLETVKIAKSIELMGREKLAVDTPLETYERIKASYLESLSFLKNDWLKSI